MKETPALTALEWVERVNRTWLVQSDLNAHAEAWLKYLSSINDGRLDLSCQAARTMCQIRARTDDPKPWFYAGLFSLATADEARRFLNSHHITKAAIPAIADDGEIKLWMDRVGPETRDLLARLRHGIAQIHQNRSGF